jgi:hypothetical protein
MFTEKIKKYLLTLSITVNLCFCNEENVNSTARSRITDQNIQGKDFGKKSVIDKESEKTKTVKNSKKKTQELPDETGPGGIPPAYLSIKDVNKCIIGRVGFPSDNFSLACLPNSKPKDCPQTSWEELVEGLPRNEVSTCKYLFDSYKKRGGTCSKCE